MACTLSWPLCVKCQCLGGIIDDVTSEWHNQATRRSRHLPLVYLKILLMWHQSLQLGRPDTHRDTHTTGCHHCGQTLTIDHMLLECALLQECRDEYYTVDSLNALFGTISETCIVEFLREAGFFCLIWCNLLTSISPDTCTIWSDLSNYLENESSSETHLLV